MKLRTKFAIALLLITVVLSTATYGGLEFYKQQQISVTQQSVNETAELTSTQIEEEIRRTKDDVGAIASRPEARDFDRSAQVADDFLANSRFFAVQIIAANGTAIAFRGDITEAARERVVGSDLSDEPYVEHVLDTGEIYMTEPEYANSTESYLTIISAPMIGEGEIKGVFAAAIWIDTTTFFRMVAPLETSTQTVQVTNGGDNLHVGEQTFSQQISSSATVEPVGWELTISRDASGLTTQLRNLAIAQGVGLLFVLGMVVVFGYWQYATNLRQTERLLRGFRRLEEGDYEHRLSLAAAEEWTQISDGFNHMSQGLKRREQQLRDRQQRLEVLYRVMRHNVRNEMSVIQNYADIIRDFTDDEILDEAAETILNAGRDLIGLSEKAGQIKSAMESADTEVAPVEVTDIVESTVADLDEEYPAVDVSTSLPDSVWVAAIPTLDMAIENVCENAYKHNDADEPTVDIAVETEGEDTVRITVADTGPGIPQQERNVLEKGRETALEHGSGLGLWLVFWIVDKSGGTLRFDENEPRGSIVTMELDQAAPPGEADPESATAAKAEDGDYSEAPELTADAED